MARTYKPVGESTAKEIAEFLLNKGITQAKIGATVDKSQSWVAGIKKECDLTSAAMEQGRQLLKDEIIKNLEDKTAKELAKNMLNSTPNPLIEANNP